MRLRVARSGVGQEKMNSPTTKLRSLGYHMVMGGGQVTSRILDDCPSELTAQENSRTRVSCKLFGFLGFLFTLSHLIWRRQMNEKSVPSVCH